MELKKVLVMQTRYMKALKIPNGAACAIAAALKTVMITEAIIILQNRPENPAIASLKATSTAIPTAVTIPVPPVIKKQTVMLKIRAG